VSGGNPGKPNPGDVLVIWNRYGPWHDMANRFEKDGGTVLVAENGYINPGGSAPKFDVHTKEGPRPGDYYAISVHGHNGSGRWPTGGPERWQALGVELKPWRTEGEHILVCGQRGIGTPLMASPPNWHENAAARIRKVTKRPVKIRTHPGNDAPKIPLSEDLKNAWACVIWSSGSGIKALTQGIPVAYDAPHWIASGGATKLSETDFESMLCDDAARLSALERMAWGQWTIAEIQTGEPFKKLMAL
jgi:hypothetical protein